MAPMATRITFIDIFATRNDLDASVIESLFEEYEVSFSIRSFGDADAATSRDEYAEKMVAVEKGQAGYARRLLAEALRKGMLSDEGSFRG